MGLIARKKIKNEIPKFLGGKNGPLELLPGASLMLPQFDPYNISPYGLFWRNPQYYLDLLTKKPNISYINPNTVSIYKPDVAKIPKGGTISNENAAQNGSGVQSKNVVGNKIVPLVSGATSIASNMISQNATVNSAEGYAQEAGTGNASYNGVGYQTYRNPDEDYEKSKVVTSGVMNTLSSTGSGIAAGAAVGGPVGAVVGGVVGLGAGLYSLFSSKSDAEKKLAEAKRLNQSRTQFARYDAAGKADQQQYYSTYGNLNNGYIYANCGKNIKKPII